MGKENKMKKYYLCNHNVNWGTEVSKNAFSFLTYAPFFGKERKIPIVLIAENDVVQEFFTKTRFECNTGYCNYSFSLPNSTLCYRRYTSYKTFDYREITPAEALKILDPCMKNKEKYVPKIHAYFDCFRKEYEQKQDEVRKQNEKNAEADKILSLYLGKR